MAITDFLSSFFPSIHADSGADDAPQEEATTEPEEEEPQDPHPEIREECQSSSKCAPLKHHFDHCQEKVDDGHGFKGEDCVEEMFHMMHCADECAAPKLFAKLK